MAKPRVFLSSTYYDMRIVRADLERFIREQGYEPVLFEKGHVPYRAEEKLEEDCYREVSTCDILIYIIGGKFGTQSSDTRYSISQNELKTAISLGKQIYIFVERPVITEYNTYLANKTTEGFQPTAVTDLRIYEFLEEIYALPVKNPIQGFEISEEIIHFLKEQWAGLFQMLLQENTRRKEIHLLTTIESTAATLDRLVKFLTAERVQGDQAIKDILLSNHPLFHSLSKTLEIPYRVFFEYLNEMEALLAARKTVLIKKEQWDSPDYREYLCTWWPKIKKILKVRVNLFDKGGKLKIVKPEEWDDNNVSLEEVTMSGIEENSTIPF